jgi:hypothetical protein
MTRRVKARIQPATERTPAYLPLCRDFFEHLAPCLADNADPTKYSQRWKHCAHFGCHNAAAFLRVRAQTHACVAMAPAATTHAWSRVQSPILYAVLSCMSCMFENTVRVF